MRKVFITGSSRGIGKALVTHFVEDVHTEVVGIARTNDFRHERYTFYPCDLSEMSEIKSLVSKLFDTLNTNTKEIILINNAGILGEMKHMGDLMADDFHQVMTVNVSAVAILMNAFISAYKKTGHAKRLIVNISSGAGKSPVDGWAAYCSSKAAVDMLSKVAAEEAAVSNSGIRIFSVAPGVADTAMQTQIRAADKAHFSKIQRFLDLKNDNELSNPNQVAQKIISFISHSEAYNDVLQDVRNMNFD